MMAGIVRCELCNQYVIEYEQFRYSCSDHTLHHADAGWIGKAGTRYVCERCCQVIRETPVIRIINPV